jgi:hypothetical protein
VALKAQTDIFFDFSITKVKNEQEPKHYRFRIKLLEDLYLYKCTTWDEAKKPTFYECRCVVLEDIHENVNFLKKYTQTLSTTHIAKLDSFTSLTKVPPERVYMW